MDARAVDARERERGASGSGREVGGGSAVASGGKRNAARAGVRALEPFRHRVRVDPTVRERFAGERGGETRGGWSGNSSARGSRGDEAREAERRGDDERGRLTRWDAELMTQFVDATLRTLRQATTEMLNLRSAGLSFEELYGAAYELVLRKQGDALYDTISDAVTDHLCLRVASKIADVAGDMEFLKALESGFSLHRRGVEMLSDVFSYLDRVHLPRSAKTNLEPVGKLAMSLWRECVVSNPRIRRRMSSCMLDLIRREREGERVDRDTLRRVTTMLLALGESVYGDEFEHKILEETRVYYRALAQKRIGIDDCPTYLQNAEMRIAQEQERSDAYMAPSTSKLLVNEVRHQLLKEMSQSLLHNATSGMVHMLRTNQIENLSRLYTLFSAMDDLEGMPDLMFSHLREVGKSIVNDSENDKNPAKFVEELLKFKDKYDNILRVAFESHRLFESQFNQAYQHIANLNPRSPENLSLYLDEVLRKPPKELGQNELESVLSRSMGLFRLFHEKDVFESYYRQHLSKRLLHKRSASDDNELAFIARLKEECGFTFTSKMECMFNDMLTSGDLNRAFHDARPASSLDVSFSVLTTGIWPSKMHKAEVHLPQECEDVCTAFENFYLSRHAGRKLKWQPIMGRAEIKARFSSGEYDLSASTLQMCVLMLFNRHETLTTAEIASLTGIGEEELKVCLQALSCVKGKNLLTKTPEGKEVLRGDTFQVNENFSSKTSKVKISTISTRRENDQERAVKNRQLTDDRKYQIEATIVRVMKAKKRLSYNEIVVEVTSQVKNRFTPTPADIKKYIENLLEKEFIRRDPNDRKVYVYIA